jgi:Arc/MetJ-type ribon-helix-helix transcriptional regulator
MSEGEMSKQRLQVTVRDDLVKWIDQEIEKARFGSRSHAIEYALTQLKESKLRRLQKHE